MFKGCPWIICLAGFVAGAAPGATNLRCEYQPQPLGIDAKVPRLSWQLDDNRRGARQTAYQVLVATDAKDLDAEKGTCWDSGKIASDQLAHVPYGGAPLASGKRYFWKVRTWDHEGKPSAWSATSWWETGLLAPGDWSARWITIADAPDATTQPGAARRSLSMRKGFKLETRPVRARVYVSGLGAYELRINGQRVGNDWCNPGWTNFGKRVFYSTYDVADLLSAGDNAVAATLGSAWWNGMDGKGKNKPRLIVQLVCEDASGKTTTLVTDGAWKARPSQIISDSFYHGEACDGRLMAPGWDRAGFDDKAWRGVNVLGDSVDVLTAQECPTMQVTAELPAASVTEVKGTYVYDFGQNASGFCRLKVKAPAGTKIQIRHAEVLNPDGTIYTANYRGAKVTDTYVCRGEGEEVWEPLFTYRGFRYAELTGVAAAPGKDALVMRVVHANAPVAGKFECSNDVINRVWKAIVWGQRSNIHAVPTDCPQRDERLGWTGDAQTFAPTACWNMDMAAYLGKYVHDMMAPVGGLVMGGGPAWSDAQVVIPWTLYRFYADRRLLEQAYPMMKSLVDVRDRKYPSGLCEDQGFGDWIAPQGSPKKPIGGAYHYYSAKIVAQAAAVLGKADDAAKYQTMCQKIAKAFDEANRDKATNTYPGKTQTSMVLPLHFGLVPAEQRKAVMDNLVKEIEAKGNHITTGFLGTAYILPVLTEGGRSDVAYRLAAQTTYPSWGYMVDHGATTIWELWNSDKAGPGMNSRNHFALGACGQWFFEALAGIELQEPGFKQITIRPRVVGDLKSASAEYPSIYGTIRSAWKLADDGKLTLEVTIPANTTATIFVPTLGKTDAKVTESGTAADQAAGVKFVRNEPDAVVYAVGAGKYSFAVTGGK